MALPKALALVPPQRPVGTESRLFSICERWVPHMIVVPVQRQWTGMKSLRHSPLPRLHNLRESLHGKRLLPEKRPELNSSATKEILSTWGLGNQRARSFFFLRAD